MRRISTIVIGTAALAFAAGSGVYYIAKQNSLKSGIAKTTQALQNVDALIDENQAEAARLFTRLEVDFGGSLPKLAGTTNPLNTAIDAFNQASAAYRATRSAETRDYVTAVGKAAESLANIWSLVNPQMALGKALIGVGADVFEAQGVLRRQAKLIEIRRQLEGQLFRLKGKDPENRADWENILSALQTDSAAERSAFEIWLRNNGFSKHDMVNAMLQSATTASSALVALGDLEPDRNEICDLLNMPGINPEFVRALNKERNYLEQGNLLAASAATFSDFHTHITPFGPPTGTELVYGTSSGQAFLPSQYVTGPHPISDHRTGCESPSPASGMDAQVKNNLEGAWQFEEYTSKRVDTPAPRYHQPPEEHTGTQNNAVFLFVENGTGKYNWGDVTGGSFDKWTFCAEGEECA